MVPVASAILRRLRWEDPLAQEVMATVSWDHTTALQLGQQSKTLSQKKKKKSKKAYKGIDGAIFGPVYLLVIDRLIMNC